MSYPNSLEFSSDSTIMKTLTYRLRGRSSDTLTIDGTRISSKCYIPPNKKISSSSALTRYRMIFTQTIYSKNFYRATALHSILQKHVMVNTNTLAILLKTKTIGRSCSRYFAVSNL